MKAYKETERKYYKYIDKEWTQPILTSNGTVGGDEYGCQADSVLYGQVYNIFDGNTSTGMTTQAGFPHWFKFYSPVPLLISKVRWVSDTNYSYNGKFQGSNDDIIWEDLATIPRGANVTFNVNTNNTYKYFRFWLPDGTYTHLNARELTLYGTERTTIESTKDDYDYYIDTSTYKLPKTVERKYYKYIKTDTPNVTINGSLTVNNGIANGFSSSNYFTVIMPSYNYELILNITTNSDISTQQNLLGNQSADNSFAVGIKNGVFALIDKTSGQTEASNTVTGGSVLANATYFLKLKNTGSSIGSQTILYYSANGIGYTLACAIAQDKPYYSPCPFGSQYSKDSTWYGFKGSIDLSNSYLISGDTKTTFTKIIKTESTPDDYDFYKDVQVYYGINQ